MYSPDRMDICIDERSVYSPCGHHPRSSAIKFMLTYQDKVPAHTKIQI